MTACKVLKERAGLRMTLRVWAQEFSAGSLRDWVAGDKHGGPTPGTRMCGGKSRWKIVNHLRVMIQPKGMTGKPNEEKAW